MTVRAMDCDGANARRNSSVASVSRSGSSIRRCRSCGCADNQTNVDPVSDVVVSTPPAISRNTTDTSSSSVNGRPSGRVAATRVLTAPSAGRARRSASSSRMRTSNAPNASPPRRARSLPATAAKMSCTGLA